MSKHTPTKAQEMAFQRVVNAIKAANQKGLVFYGKQDSLIAYTIGAENYINKNDFDKLLCTGFYEIPYLASSLLRDSGADDYAKYLTQADQDNFNPNN